LKPISVLLVDNNPIFLRVAARFLETHAEIAVVGTAAGGEEGLARALLVQIPVDVFLCDVHVGSERGTDLLREQLDTLRQHGTQVIMVSGEAQYRPMCEEMGVDFYMEKPVAIGPLVKLVDRLTA